MADRSFAPRDSSRPFKKSWPCHALPLIMGVSMIPNTHPSTIYRERHSGGRREFRLFNWNQSVRLWSWHWKDVSTHLNPTPPVPVPMPLRETSSTVLTTYEIVTHYELSKAISPCNCRMKSTNNNSNFVAFCFVLRSGVSLHLWYVRMRVPGASYQFRIKSTTKQQIRSDRPFHSPLEEYTFALLE